MIILDAAQIAQSQVGLEPNSIPRWHQLTDDGGVHAMRVRLDAKTRDLTYSICAPPPKVQPCLDAPRDVHPVRWEIHHGHMHYGVGGLVVAKGGLDVSLDVTGPGGGKMFARPIAVDLMRPYGPPNPLSPNNWVPLDFGGFTDKLPLELRFELTARVITLGGDSVTFDFFVVVRIAPPHRCSPNLPDGAAPS